ncbi:hypothetical protein B5X24_HaOG203402 [Helicoverpa armigera]|uniref:Uncharacterized protein n=1 Tax=Helicoverpa armigera TaxID=29058 RepID=A0A2W1BQR8_HELAM|nr:hypothetical protein B5X24_HaOG203402 [Helicoverpa armigera]
MTPSNKISLMLCSAIRYNKSYILTLAHSFLLCGGENASVSITKGWPLLAISSRLFCTNIRVKDSGITPVRCILS